jgi:hypothetical protein
MQIVEKYFKNNDVISLKYIGLYPKIENEIEEVYKFVKKQKDQHQCKRFIIDFRKSVYDPSVSDMLSAAERMKTHGLDNTSMSFISTSKPNYGKS